MRWVKGVLRVVITAILMILCAILFYVLVIMGDSPNVEYEMSAASAVRIVVEDTVVCHTL